MIAITQVHRGDNPAEVERIQQNGGQVVRKRVGGTLAVTRAFGDRIFSLNIVSEIPYIHTEKIQENDILILASDGVIILHLFPSHKFYSCGMALNILM